MDSTPQAVGQSPPAISRPKRRSQLPVLWSGPFPEPALVVLVRRGEPSQTGSLGADAWLAATDQSSLSRPPAAAFAAWHDPGSSGAQGPSPLPAPTPRQREMRSNRRFQALPPGASIHQPSARSPFLGMNGTEEYSSMYRTQSMRESSRRDASYFDAIITLGIKSKPAVDE